MSKQSSQRSIRKFLVRLSTFSFSNKDYRIFFYPLAKIIKYNFSSVTDHVHSPNEHAADKNHSHAHEENETLVDVDAEFNWADRPMPNYITKTGYFSDPEINSIKICSLLMQHEEIKVKKIKLNMTWSELGLSELGRIEFFVELMNDFGLDIPSDDLEKFKNVYDVTQYISKSCFVH